ncbi:type I-B CRISPR-associated endonuclease Cas1b [Calditerricola satsumensis]|uniref:CRISPR-associated endonuclease Cas1 n=1 Tax=Calditerricola satsumensis TaxID=373054 RepID=A0A8J3BE35_9BACI|nr:type I-B CRISPR-associated endonuclease Cas1b [Calditerricola satsumensis]GGK07170.1 subtype I-B CRISPR-associated endonuclease Cas1 [Calditerricola satsumensis]
MKESLYIFRDGQLRRKDHTLLFETADGKRYVPVEHVREIFLFGEVDVTKKMLEFCSQKEIPVHIYSHYGYYMGTFYPREHHVSGYVLLKQAEHYLDPSRRLALARRFVEGALDNMLNVLRYYKNRGKAVEPMQEAIESHRREVETAGSIEALMAAEGHARQAYYQAFDAILEDEAFRFGMRSRRPPRNRLNALISFGNSLLYSAVLREIYHTQLDPRIGFLHAANFRRFSLNLDVAEVFKPLLVDRVIFRVLGRRQIQADDFLHELGGLVLRERAQRVFVEEFEKGMRTTLQHRRLKRKVSYRQLIRLELYKIQKHLLGDEPYTPFVSRW